MVGRIWTMGLLVLGLAAGAEAGQEAADGVDVSRLPVSVERIHRGLQEAAIRDESEGLNIQFVVSVFAPSPPLELWTNDFDLRYGPVPGTAPTHQEVIEHLTPREYRAPAADLGALFRWIAEKTNRD